MRNLGFGLNERIDPATQGNYSKLYGQPLAESHVVALAALFGWTVEEGEQVRSLDLIAFS